MRKRGCSKYCYALALLIVLGSAVCIVPADVYAGGGVYLGFGVDVPLPGPGMAPPGYPPPVVVERSSPPPVVVERMPPPPPLVVRRAPPVAVSEAPVVVERRTTTVYYYPSPYQYRPYREETEREYYRQRTQTYRDDDQY